MRTFWGGYCGDSYELRGRANLPRPAQAARPRRSSAVPLGGWDPIAVEDVITEDYRGSAPMTFDTSNPTYQELLGRVLESGASVVPFVGAGLSVYGRQDER